RQIQYNQSNEVGCSDVLSTFVTDCRCRKPSHMSWYKEKGQVRRMMSILAGIVEDRKGSPLLSAGGFTEKTLLKLARAFMWMMNNSVNLFEKSDLHEKPHTLEEDLTPAQDPGKIKGILALYHKNKIQEGYHYLIAGHTHAVGRFQDWYYNCGCWVGLRTHFLEILHDGQIHVCEWKRDHPIVMEKVNLCVEETESSPF
ncbi:MAG: hypothetical protein KBI46_10930, partial [Phycisphaerae bacterium]|nr:hypothetical protein [Phycisphaerae bacterium]